MTNDLPTFTAPPYAAEPAPTAPEPSAPPAPADGRAGATSVGGTDTTRWSARKTAVTAGLALVLTSAGAIGAAAALPAGSTGDDGRGFGGGRMVFPNGFGQQNPSNGQGQQLPGFGQQIGPGQQVGPGQLPGLVDPRLGTDDDSGDSGDSDGSGARTT